MTAAPTHQLRPAATTKPAAHPNLLQRKCACDDTSSPTGECAECRRNRLDLQRSAAGPSEISAAPPIVNEVLRSPGQRLDGATRALMEPRFGYDFSKVRVHADRAAAESARAVAALAYTVGNEIVFGSGQYTPHTAEGQKLLAHELTHVVQQGGSAFNPGTALALGAKEDSYERQADVIATHITKRSGRAMPISSDDQSGSKVRRLAPGPGVGSGTPTPAPSWTPDLITIRFDGDPLHHLFCSGEATLSSTTMEPDCVPPVMMRTCPSRAVPFTFGGYTFQVRFYVDAPSTPYPLFLPPPTVSVEYYYLTKRGRRTFGASYSDPGPSIDRTHPGTELGPSFGTHFSLDVERSGTLYVRAELQDKSGFRITYNHRVGFVCPARARGATPTAGGPTISLPRPLPRTEAEELIECISIMGAEHAAECRDQVLGEEEPE